MKFRIPILRSLSPEETAKLIITSYHQLTECKRNSRYRPWLHKKKDKFGQQIFVLQGLPGIGPARAKRLLDKFGTLSSIFTANISELKEVEGIGKYTAQQIYSLLYEPCSVPVTK